LSGAIIEQVSVDARRDAVIEGASVINHHKLYRRLYLAQSLMEDVNLSTYEDEIRGLRSKDKKLFSIRVHANLYKLTSRVISNILKESVAYEQKGYTV